MKTMACRFSCRSRQRQHGAVILEFTLALVLFLTFLLGVIDVSRMLFTWNAAAEATRVGARYAVVCDDTSQGALVLARMRQWLPQIGAVDVAWTPAACTPANCTGVTVSIRQLDYQWISPIAGQAARFAPWAMPRFARFLPREVMRQDPHSAALCASAP